MFMCKDTYVPHKFIFEMFITYLMYTLVTITKVNSVAEKINAFKNASVLIVVLNLLLGKLCCSVVKLSKLKVRCQCLL